MAWDFTCPDTLPPISHLKNVVYEPGIVTCEAEDKKRAKYVSLAPSFCFVPVAVETLCALGADTVELLLEHGRRITESTVRRASCNGVSTPKAKCCTQVSLPEAFGRNPALQYNFIE